MTVSGAHMATTSFTSVRNEADRIQKRVVSSFDFPPSADVQNRIIKAVNLPRNHFAPK
jgi:hypothetical protein